MLFCVAPLLLWTGCWSNLPEPLIDKIPTSEGRLRVVTYNVHLGEALKDERKSGALKSMRETFREEKYLWAVDILGLQELCSDEGGWQLAYFDELMRSWGGPSYSAYALADPVEKTMCARVEAIYSRHPIIDSGVIELPNVRQPRSAVWADIDVPSSDGKGTVRIRVYNAHLENRPTGMSWEEGRLRQTRVILAHLEEWRATHPDAPVILLGDLNSLSQIWNFWDREASIDEIQSHGLDPTLKKYNRTSTMTPHQLDWIFFKGLKQRRAQVQHVWLSDHFPVATDFALPSAPAVAEAP
ncbi:endonuclease/exonuclease/phosphatase family protein [Pyxidicoccus parkwayensis]|uniref:Endonuclease/exonuclease/phosphatase family protein n=1 Tax=Pyxidicoccus parkwayensis TaxID=2813578 RepID=A0ABX7P3G0_9BACT|nr:endonuclease/exonuclease/phosphatase family protein [Pyxidicoccus parkwaysis]QSQ25015.1 endonuclease/exonuclease/phosphatase family protein [Pyxidicoccus parkwaysis]